MFIGKRASGAAVVALAIAAAPAAAQPPADIAQGLQRIGQIVDPACTAKLYRPLMPKQDFNTYWPPDAPKPAMTGPLYPGITIARDRSFGPHDKDLLDIFTADRGGRNLAVLVYIPGGGGNKIEQQVREANAFYDNIGRWAAKNGMVGVLMQRHAGENWDDGGRDVSVAVDCIREHAATFGGDPNRIFLWAHSAGTGPLGVYVGHANRWKNGTPVKGAIFMSGNPIPSLGAAPGGRGAGPGGPPGFGAGPAPGSACGVGANMGSNDGRIAGPSGQQAPAGGPGGPGRGGRGQLTPEQIAERDNLPGFKTTNVKIMLARAEFDPGVSGDMTAADKAVRDELCKADGPNAKEGAGHCPTIYFVKAHSHMSEVFSLDTPDTTVGDRILAWIKSVR
jgi:triacylglycerol lipase